MAKNTYKSNTFKNNKQEKTPSKGLNLKAKLSPTFLKDRRFQLTLGLFLLLVSLFVFVSCVSYLFTGKADQSVVESAGVDGIIVSGREAANWMKLWGAYASHYLIFKWFGIAAFLVPPFLFILGYRVVFGKALINITRAFIFVVFFLIWLSLLMGSLIKGASGVTEWSFYSGGLGYELAIIFDNLLGYGTLLFLVFTFLVFVIFFFDIRTVFTTKVALSNADDREEKQTIITETRETITADLDEEDDEISEEELENWVLDVKGNEKELIENDLVDEDESENDEDAEEAIESEFSLDLEEEDLEEEFEAVPAATELKSGPAKGLKEEPDFEVEIKEAAEKLVETVGNYDPTLDLAKYQYPSIELLKEYAPSKVQVTKDELEANKNRIVETLTNFKIGIASIKATIGPTVTLYEIIPDAGVKISKIKNLEDDIALSLAALGIRIIAPIPGKGTIGIEVPNKNKEMVSMRSVIATDKFMNSTMALPIALGKTISNEVFVTDLAKMPHLLMAGATGQGKSVGLNALLTSLLYKKHPSQLKFVLVDPKKVELTIYNKIERHFLAKLPDGEEAIITDTKKVIYTLNSLCIEMDQRYDLLKDAACRNIKEYNEKFIDRRLNPEKGHRYLPYIVLVIDELADLMMTAGKEVETPIARLAQLARAIGIHLVVATQRPSVNVITGIIKANFPARLSFRVTSKIDSRTILDTGGADQLIGQGDMLLSNGSEITRIQCAFVDTPEVDDICDFIGAQKGYDTAYMLPEFSGDEGDSSKSDVDLSDRDGMFNEAARLIVAHQQGSTSLIQRKLKLGYNRAGRIIDQLEAAGIVGPFEGSKAREVLISDEYSLEQLLNSLDSN
uniref:DNA translocase FtsK 4TM domain-containing protein n=1 Tax=Roseivirga sp. TaxID=1964215 RepID=UPI004048525D